MRSGADGSFDWDDTLIPGPDTLGPVVGQVVYHYTFDRESGLEWDCISTYILDREALVYKAVRVTRVESGRIYVGDV